MDIKECFRSLSDKAISETNDSDVYVTPEEFAAGLYYRVITFNDPCLFGRRIVEKSERLKKQGGNDD